MRKLLPILSLCLLTTAACTAGASPTPNASASAAPSTPAPTAPAYAVSTAPNDLILRIATGGGLVPPGYMLTAMPSWALYGDGRIIVPGPVAEIYPGPLVPSLRVQHVTPAEIQRIVAAADEAGLLGPDASYDATNIMDAGSTMFTTVVGGKVHRIGAYALGIYTTDPGMDPAVAAERAKLLVFENKAFDLSTFLGRTVDGSEIYRPQGMQVFVHDAGPVDTSQPTAQTLAWPLAADPLKTGEPTATPGIVCLVVSGGDLATFEAAAANAHLATVWTFGSARYSAGVRPMYPNESGCAGNAL